MTEDQTKEIMDDLLYTCDVLKSQVSRWKSELERIAKVGPEHTFDEIIKILEYRLESNK